MKKTNRILSIVTVIALIAAMSTGICFAAAEPPTVPNVEVYLTTPAFTADFTISEDITMKAKAGQTDFESITPIEIRNNATLGQLKLSSLKAAGQSGWTIVDRDDSYFAKLPTNTKEFSLQSVTVGGYDHRHIFKAAELTFDVAGDCGDDSLIAPQATLSVTFSGKVGTHTSAYTDKNMQVAQITPTIEIYTA